MEQEPARNEDEEGGEGGEERGRERGVGGENKLDKSFSWEASSFNKLYPDKTQLLAKTTPDGTGGKVGLFL